MHKKEYLPACYRYIKEDNRSHILYTLAKKTPKIMLYLPENFTPSCALPNCRP